MCVTVALQLLLEVIARICKSFSDGMSVTGHKDIVGKPAVVCILDLFIYFFFFAASSLVGTHSARIVWDAVAHRLLSCAL